MNHHVLPPLGLALITGLFIPWMLVRARWAQQVPRLGLAVWIMCGAVFALARRSYRRSCCSPGRPATGSSTRP